ncbi:MAG TPA: ATP-binding protein, partial [Phnomibacter sp.]|nr:ATP-binding protein [Phnomibacter sp.]
LIRGTAAIFQHTNLNYGIFRSFRFTIQSQIRLTIIAILFISFLIIAYITIRFFVGQYQQANEEKLSRTIQHVYADITLKIPDDFLQMPDTERASFMREQLTQLAKAGDADINFYDSRGKLLATTQDILFTKQVLGGIINPEAYRKLTYGKLNRFIAREKIGDLEYISIYQPLRSTNRDLVGYLQVPFFSSQSELNQEISNFVVILINIIAFVFLLSGGLALWISGGITRSFSLIAQRMKEIRLSERNERIEWYTDDEIGNLVHQYNRMVDQLEESAALLAKSERETAWREMARQVAHEIKNPLTPMKLSLQYLQKTIEENRTDVAKITDRVAATLVSQIDHLSNIAAEFSQFANIGNTRPELFDLHTVLKDLVQLYALQQDIQVQWRPVNNPVWVMADKTQMNRLFTNLLQNAYEARGHQNAMIITLSETLEESYITIAVQDNGPGIPPSIQERIFMPNFTTKTSGTGLGLAICKAIVENAQGHIWFDTTAENGTCFYVKLPVYHP